MARPVHLGKRKYLGSRRRTLFSSYHCRNSPQILHNPRTKTNLIRATGTRDIALRSWPPQLPTGDIAYFSFWTRFKTNMVPHKDPKPPSQQQWAHSRRFESEAALKGRARLESRCFVLPLPRLPSPSLFFFFFFFFFAPHPDGGEWC